MKKKDIEETRIIDTIVLSIVTPFFHAETLRLTNANNRRPMTGSTQ